MLISEAIKVLMDTLDKDGDLFVALMHYGCEEDELTLVTFQEKDVSTVPNPHLS